MSSSIKAPKKLIEVALPLDDINAAAARAILFAQLVNDPDGERGYFAGKTKKYELWKQIKEAFLTYFSKNSRIKWTIYDLNAIF